MCPVLPCLNHSLRVVGNPKFLLVIIFIVGLILLVLYQATSAFQTNLWYHLSHPQIGTATTEQEISDY